MTFKSGDDEERSVDDKFSSMGKGRRNKIGYADIVEWVGFVDFAPKAPANQKHEFEMGAESMKAGDYQSKADFRCYLKSHIWCPSQ